MESSSITLFFQGEGLIGFEEVTIDQDSAGQVLLERIIAVRALPGDSWALFVEDEDEAVDLNVSLRERGIKHRHRMHVHRCRKIDVRAEYNNENRDHSFSPGTTVGKVKDYFIDKFKIDPMEAHKLALWYGEPPQIAEDDDHIGKFANSKSNCAVTMQLAPKVRPQG
jgi:hypothetical protein